jgi:hypothetical protein
MFSVLVPASRLTSLSSAYSKLFNKSTVQWHFEDMHQIGALALKRRTLLTGIVKYIDGYFCKKYSDV